MSTLSSREFNQDVGRAKRDARLGPVFITDRGKPTHVLLSFEAFQALSGKVETIIDLLAIPDTVEIDIEAARAGDGWDRRAAVDESLT